MAPGGGASALRGALAYARRWKIEESFRFSENRVAHRIAAPARVGSSAQTTVAGHARLRISSGYVRCLLPPVSIKPSFLDVTV